MRKVLIFYCSYGGGHLTAARSVKEYIDANYDDTETLLVDCIEYINKALNKVSTKAFVGISKNAHWAWKQLYYSAENNGTFSKISNAANRVMAIKLKKLIKKVKPDLIVSTHMFSSQMCSRLKKKRRIHCKLATIMTDYETHNQWLINYAVVDYFFVAHDGMKNALISKGIDKNKIFVAGIPLSNRFLANYDKEKILSDFGLQVGKITILFFAGGEYGFGKDKTFRILKSLISSFINIQVIAIAGKNIKMKEQFETLVAETGSNENVKVLEYTDKVPELMSVSDLVITKPGGLTTTESIASRSPDNSY